MSATRAQWSWEPYKVFCRLEVNSHAKLGHCIAVHRADDGELAGRVAAEQGDLLVPSSLRMPGNHIHGNGLPATFVPGRRNVCEGCWAVDESLKNHLLLFFIAS